MEQRIACLDIVLAADLLERRNPHARIQLRLERAVSRDVENLSLELGSISCELKLAADAVGER